MTVAAAVQNPPPGERGGRGGGRGVQVMTLATPAWPDAGQIPAKHAQSGGEISPGKSVDTDQEILNWVARDAETALHPSCTCRMGVDDGSVVDPKTMRVHGVAGLSVADASAMPYVTNGNIYAPVMMLAEKAADLILGNTPLPPGQCFVLSAPAYI